MEISLDITRKQSIERSVPELLGFLDKQGLPFVIAIDEFQQILKFPEKNIEAMLRTCIQQLKNVNFIFCGSHLHLMSEIFNSAKRPFFASCSNLYLDKIEQKSYVKFMRNNFEKLHYTVEENALDLILELTDSHTYYTQKLCHEIVLGRTKKINETTVHQALQKILLESEMIYFQYRNLLTASQWEILKAVAKEEKVFQPYARSFIKKHQLTASNVKRAIVSLVEKEMLFFQSGKEEPYYEVQDKFLMRWLQYK